MADDDKKTCFIIMPITTPEALLRRYNGDGQHFGHVLQHLLVPAVEAVGYSAIGPAARGAEFIHARMIEHLEQADLVLCDMSALNPNVFFELGIRTAVNKPAALVRDTFTEDTPFDLSVINHHTYDPSLSSWTVPGEVDRLAEHLRQTADAADGTNSLWREFSFTTQAAPIESPSRDEKLDYLIRQVQSLADARRQVVFRAPVDEVLWKLREHPDVGGAYLHEESPSTVEVYVAHSIPDASERQIEQTALGLGYRVFLNYAPSKAELDAMDAAVTPEGSA